MARKSGSGTKFKSEAEEADWYQTAQGREQTAREFARALRAGSLERSAGLKVTRTDPRLLEQLMQQAKENATRAVSLRIPIVDLERAKQLAKESGVGYQTVLKKAIRAGLRKAG
jgi:predicted DNA binding CopG/RHH family protein